MSEENKATAPKMGVTVIKSKNYTPYQSVVKADISTQIKEGEQDGVTWLSPEHNLDGLGNLAKESSILPQCITAYGMNIAGFGISIDYKRDEEETEEMGQEFDYAQQVLTMISPEKAIKEVIDNWIKDAETYGIGYLECIRNEGGQVVEITNIENVPSMWKSRQDDDYTEYETFYNGETIHRKKRFRRFKQEVNGKTVYYKEFGDPRVMSWKTGNYLNDGDVLDIPERANEILEYKIGKGTYGTVRWWGQIRSVDGSAMAENLNNNYFVNGRHTPLMICVTGGTLSDESRGKLQEYIDGIKGEAGQHSFLLLEMEEQGDTTALNDTSKVNVEIKDMASILQKDELFQDYLENNRKRVQSAFRLPDIYVAYTSDYNRATAQAAMEVTEKQVFQPMRESLAWTLNNKILASYGFQHVECALDAPDISNPDDMQKILTVAGTYGGITANMAHQIAREARGEESEDYEGDWANLPVSLLTLLSAQNDQYSQYGAMGTAIGEKLNSNPFKKPKDTAEEKIDVPEQDEIKEPDDLDAVNKEYLASEVERQIKKELSTVTPDDTVVAVMKEVRNLLIKMEDKA